MPEDADTTDNARGKADAKTPGTAIVTLVKPMQENTGAASPQGKAESSSARNPRQPRPKVGRNVAFSGEAGGARKDVTAKEAEEKTALSIEAPAIEAPAHAAAAADAAHRLAPRMQERLSRPEGSHARPWDFKFALFLVALFVGVNLCLIGLLNHHTAETPVIRPAPAPPVSAPRPRLELRDKSPVLPPALSHAAQQPLLNLPSASSAVQPPAPPRRQPVAPQMTPGVKPQEKPQELYSIINKE